MSASLGVCPAGPPFSQSSIWREERTSEAGSSSIDLIPTNSRKWSVVPYWIGRPGSSARPTTVISSRSRSLAMPASADTPRTASISERVTGWR